MVAALFLQDYPIVLENNPCNYVDFLAVWSNKSIALLGLFHPSTLII